MNGRFGTVTRMVSSLVAEVKGMGGTVQNRFISPKGLYSKPKGDDAVIIPLSKGNAKDVILVLQREKELDDGDVILTDDASYIHFHFNGQSIEVKTAELVLNADKLVVNGDTEFNGSVKANGKKIDHTHTHGGSPVPD